MKSWIGRYLRVALALGAGTAHAQANDRCADVLAIGLRDVMAGSYNRDLATATSDFFLSEKSNQVLGRAGLKALIPLEELPVPVEVGLSSEQRNEWRQKFSRNRRININDSQATQFLTSELSPLAPAAIAAWHGCITSSKSASGPARAIVTSYDGEKFFVNITYEYEGGARPPKIRSLRSENADCGELPKQGDVLDKNIILWCSRSDPTKSALVHLAFIDRHPMSPSVIVPPRAKPSACTVMDKPTYCIDFDSSSCVCRHWLRKCLEMERCDGLPYACYLDGGDSDNSRGLIFSKQSGGGAERPRTETIAFGPWSNAECGPNGKGWAASAGSCTTGKGSKLKRCAFVLVDTSRFE